MDTSFFEVPGWSQHRGQGRWVGGWDTNSTFCGWLLGQRLRGEIRYPLLIESVQNTTDKMFPKFSWASRRRAGLPAPLCLCTRWLIGT